MNLSEKTDEEIYPYPDNRWSFILSKTMMAFLDLKLMIDQGNWLG